MFKRVQGRFLGTPIFSTLKIHSSFIRSPKNCILQEFRISFWYPTRPKINLNDFNNNNHAQMLNNYSVNFGCFCSDFNWRGKRRFTNLDLSTSGAHETQTVRILLLSHKQAWKQSKHHQSLHGNKHGKIWARNECILGSNLKCSAPPKSQLEFAWLLGYIIFNFF